MYSKKNLLNINNKLKKNIEDIDTLSIDQSIIEEAFFSLKNS